MGTVLHAALVDLTAAVRLAVIAVTFLLAMLPAFALAGPPENDQAGAPRLTELSLEQLGDLEVTSVSKQPEEVWRTAVAVYVITQDDIRRSGATSIPEILRLAPGIEVARIDSDHWAVGVRGFGDQFSKSLLVMIDGRSLYTPLFAGMYWPAHDALIEDIDRVEVIRGPGGTIWGANAVNGVVNIITRSAAETPGMLMSIGSGNIDRGAAALRYGGGNGSSLNYRAYGKGVSRGPQFHSDGSRFDDWWMSQAGFRTDWQDAAGQSLTLQGDVSRGSHGQRVSITSHSPPAMIAADGALDASGVNLLARWQRDFTPTRGFRLQGYFDRTSWSAPNFGETRETFDIDFVHHQTLARRHSLTWGAGARQSPSRFIQTIPTLDFTPHRETGSIYSGFAQDEMLVRRDRLWLTVGSKLEHNNYTGIEMEPTARLLWIPRSGQTAWAAVTRAVRTPSRIERGIVSRSLTRAVAAVPVFLDLVGNPDFSAERMTGYEAGYRTLVAPQLYLDAAAFHNRHEGLSSFGLLSGATLESSPPPVHAVVRVSYVNGVSGSSDGFEISPDWRPRQWWQLKGSYSYVRFDLVTTPGSIDVNAVARYEGASPHHQVRLQTRVDLPRGTEIDGAYRYVSALPALLVAGYHTADARIGWRVSSRVDLSVSGQNLLQPHHAEFAHSPGPAVEISRSVYAALTWRPASGRP